WLPPEPVEPVRGTVVLPKRRERLWEIRDVAELEKGVPRMIREGRPGIRMKHPLDDRAVASGGLAPDPPPGDAVLRFDERDDLLAEVIVIPTGRGRIDVLVTAHPGEAVDHGHDHGPHLPRPDEAIQLRLQVLSERIDAEERFSGSRVANDPICRGIPFPWIVLRREVDGHVPPGRIPKRIPFQHHGVEALDDDVS